MEKENVKSLFDKLVILLKFKKNQNAIYFRVVEDFFDKEFNFTVQKKAMLLFSEVPTNNEETVFISVIYDNMDNEDEGLHVISYKILASLLIAGKIKAFYINNNKLDTEIKNYLDFFKMRKEID